MFLIYVSLRKCQTELRFSQSKGAVSYKKEPISSKSVVEYFKAVYCHPAI